MNLYELNTNYNHLIERLYDEDIDQQTLLDTIESIEDAIESKADSYAIIMKSIDKDIDFLDDEIKRLQAKQKSLKARKGYLMSNLEKCMRDTGKTKFKTKLFSFGIQKAGGLRKLTLKVDVDKLPDRFQKVVVEPDMTALRLALNDTEENEYCFLEKQRESLRIR